MFTSDNQILKLLDILIDDNVIAGSAQFFEETGISKSYFSKVKNQEKYGRAYHFTPAQIEKVCLQYSINFNFIFATSEDVYVEKKKAQKVHKIN